MATNRLYLIDEESGAEFCLAKSSSGWFAPDYNGGDEYVERLNEFLEGTDIGAACGGKETALKLVTENSDEYLEFTQKHRARKNEKDGE